MLRVISSRRFRKRPLCVVVVATSLFAFPSAASPAPREATIYRDTWGVPHIVATTDESAAYAHAYAQAEDRIDDIFIAYRVALGLSAEVLGESRLEDDRAARMARHGEIARRRYDELGSDIRRILEAYVAGLRAYMEQHPDKVPEFAFTPEAHHPVALYRAFAWGWPWDQALGDLKRRGSHAGDGRASNQWVVAPSHSAEGGAIALIDPHLSWDPVSRFYESHVRGDRLVFYGFSIIGTPIMALGHTDVLAFSCTTGGPDCADVYELKLHPDDPLRYEYDGDWRTLEVEEITIRVRTSEGTRLEKTTIERSHHGPVVRRDGDRAFAVKTAYQDEVGLIEQWLEMARARNLGEFLSALALNQSLPQNIMYADVYGNSYYLRAGRVPIRPEGFAWDRPVPGWTSASEWRGIHPLQDLVQLLNPPQGWMQNCNVSPAMITSDKLLLAKHYPGYIYNSAEDRNNSRGRQAQRLLAARERITLDDALAIAVDTYVDRSDRWQAALGRAFETHAEAFARLASAIELLQGWDGRMDRESRAAALFRLWIRASREGDSGVPRSEIWDGVAIDDAGQHALLRALESAVRTMTNSYGRIDVPWGRIQRARRGDRSWPVGGVRSDGLKTLRSVRASAPDEQGISWARGGQFCTTVVVLSPGEVRSFSATPYGQSNDPQSPHYTDQGERLFSAGKLKDTWYGEAALLKNLESTRTLKLPESTGAASR